MGIRFRQTRKLRFLSAADATCIGATLAPVFGYFLGSPQVGAIAFILALFVWAKHAGNIRRLISGSESQIDVSSSEDG